MLEFAVLLQAMAKACAYFYSIMPPGPWHYIHVS